MRKYKILVVDYEPRSVAQIERALAGERFDLEFAANGIEAIQTFHRIQPDLTLIEAMIPKKHGFEVCQELKGSAHGKATPVLIATSVYKGRKYRHQAMHHYGANGYIEKPVTDDGLRRAVRDALGADDLDPVAVPTKTAGREHAGASAAADGDADIGRRGPAANDDDAEIEILERLDSLLPGGSGTGEGR